jgi:hypothetical protein
MAGVYAVYVMGAKDVVALDKDLKPLKYRVISVEQGSHNEVDSKTMNQVVKLGKMIVKLDGRANECIEFKRFGSQQEYEEWKASKARSEPPPASK